MCFDMSRHISSQIIISKIIRRVSTEYLRVLKSTSGKYKNKYDDYHKNNKEPNNNKTKKQTKT